jgi:oxygen-independent coproporphyrinogen-3 oxidase
MDNFSTGHDRPEFVRDFPWRGRFSESDLSTTRGFVFQYPPFPVVADRTTAEILDTRETAGLYVHLPFCPYHCDYCYYAVSLDHRRESIERYLRALKREITVVAARAKHGHKVTTVFFGGGTPTYLTSDDLLGVASCLREHFGLEHLEEFTVEGDPTTLTLEKLQALRYGGVNRISIGIQSFTTAVNFANERKHSFEQSLAAIALARMAGFSNINIDLICGLVGETESSWDTSLKTLLAVAPEHVTIYLFSLRPQTRAFVKLNRTHSAPPSEERRVAWMLEVTERLLQAGYRQTTANCFVRRPEFEQIHQRNAWSSLPLIGFGNSAYSYFDNAVTQNVRSIDKYRALVEFAGDARAIRVGLNCRDQMTRYCILRLKQLRIPRAEFARRFGFELFEIFGERIQALVELGLVEVDDAAVTATRKGAIYVDDACRLLYGNDVQDRMSHLEDTALRPLIRSLV